jgi:cell wall-associated NlpC family hydrolase
VILNEDQIAQYAYRAGFRGQALQWITQIAMRESGGKTDAYNPNAHTGDQSWGLVQVNTLGGLGAGRKAQLQSMGLSGDFHDLWDPAVNMAMAYKLSNGGTNFEPWRSASPGWGGPQGFLTNTDQYAAAASSAAAKAMMGAASNQTRFLSGVQASQNGMGTKQSQMVSWLQQQVGKNYQYASAGPNAFDCSGLVEAMLAPFGIHVPGYTVTQAQAGMPVDANNLQPGDLVFFHGAPQPNVPAGSPGHVGVYIGGGQYIEAPHTGAKVQVAQLDPSSLMSARRYIDAQGRYITGGGPYMPQLDPSVQTVNMQQAATGLMPSLNMSTTSPTTASPPSQAFALPTHDFNNVLPGLGKEVASLV